MKKLKFLTFKNTRQQLNLNGLQTQLKYDEKSKELKNEMVNIQIDKQDLQKSLRDESMEKENVLHILEQTESKKFWLID